MKKIAVAGGIGQWQACLLYTSLLRHQQQFFLRGKLGRFQCGILRACKQCLKQQCILGSKQHVLRYQQHLLRQHR